MGKYQSFPNTPGAADSPGKLAHLSLPPLAGKTFLDVGCNEGFFCGYASFEAASKVVGIDKDESSLREARARFPYCDFRHGDWENLDEILKDGEKFDLILMASALHYSRDQQATIQNLIERLAPDGTLVLEMGIVENPDAVQAQLTAPGWYDVKRSIDSRSFPDWKGAEALFSPYAYKYYGKSVQQIGDPLTRHVFHLQKLKPVAILMTGNPASGKSTLARTLSSAVKLIRGDVLLLQLGSNPEAYGMPGDLLANINSHRIDLTIKKLCRSGALKAFAAALAREANGESFIYDGFIPAEYAAQFGLFLQEEGFRICNLATPVPELSPNMLSRRSRIEARKYLMFLSAFESARKINKAG